MHLLGLRIIFIFSAANFISHNLFVNLVNLFRQQMGYGNKLDIYAFKYWDLYKKFFKEEVNKLSLYHQVLEWLIVGVEFTNSNGQFIYLRLEISLLT